MTVLVCISLVFFSLAGYVFSQEHPNRTIAYIGEKCERDIDCIDNAFCQGQEVCRCDPFYSPSLDGSKCTATVGLTCLNYVQCQSIANGECKQNTCTCKDDFFLDNRNFSNCISRPVIIGDRCQLNTNDNMCQERFNMSLCINEKCQCHTGHHFVNQTKTCMPSRALYFSCSFDYECYESDRPSTMLCKDGQCVCKEGERCSKGSLMTAAGTLMAILLFLQRIAH
ncbi:PREDICTED: platelet endothelial aggregation receptor 1-like [Wasmannia auropunctata]|uniref:platelet endothelial aggregation receptor 1-like n=1 Tax=Wasmannia auropunctata TaxID=64793 RepID=UPI0005EFE740|nr:PREDICTED: platelet endothelial aggregation receptor 1-like [Wasmannia auropunctata]